MGPGYRPLIMVQQSFVGLHLSSHVRALRGVTRDRRMRRQRALREARRLFRPQPDGLISQRLAWHLWSGASISRVIKDRLWVASLVRRIRQGVGGREPRPLPLKWTADVILIFVTRMAFRPVRDPDGFPDRRVGELIG